MNWGMRNTIVVAFIAAGAVSWLWPGYAGVFVERQPISVGEGHIIGAIFFVGAAIVGYLRPPIP